jgi:hypothetical protein
MPFFKGFDMNAVIILHLIMPKSLDSLPLPLQSQNDIAN